MWPSHLVFFGALLRERGVEDVLRAKGYTEVWRGGNGIEEDARRRGGVRVWHWGARNRFREEHTLFSE
jgi:phosphatidylinositol glycan class B